MKTLYLTLDLGSIAIPFLASFHPRLKFYRKWRPLFLSLLITSAVFITWDVYFTEIGVWGFNEQYFLGYNFLGLPIEEWLFFLCIPYACIFSHYTLIELFPKFSLSSKWVNVITFILLLTFLTIYIFNFSKLYTAVNYSLAFLVLLITYLFRPRILRTFFWTFLFMLIPFFVVNGLLTGTLIDNQVVWYDNSENLGIRILTIPIEDMAYAFSLVLMNMFLMSLFDKKH